LATTNNFLQHMFAHISRKSSRNTNTICRLCLTPEFPPKKILSWELLLVLVSPSCTKLTFIIAVLFLDTPPFSITRQIWAQFSLFALQFQAQNHKTFTVNIIIIITFTQHIT
jgi:hypothetical protein